MERMLRINPVSNERGFTLIELIMIIVILGLLAAVAIPKYVDLRGDAGDAAVDGVAAALGSASAINLAVYPLGKQEEVADCQDVANVIEGGMPSGYTITSASITGGGTATCTVTASTGGYTSTFLGHGVTAP
jgi:MSHA pilin protein MshA